MKQYLILSACLLAALACSKEQSNGTENAQPAVVPMITATIESQVTKLYLGDKDASDNYEIKWSEGDQIGVRVYSGEDYISGSNMSWTLKEQSKDLIEGCFKPDGDITNKNFSYAAYFPMESYSNIGGDGKYYYQYKDSYDSYTPGRFISPLIANMNEDLGGVDRQAHYISLKHVGATVKITLNNVPAEANKIKLTIDNNNISGAWANIEPSNAGSNPSFGGTGHTVALNFDAGSVVRNGLVFYFPVPALTTPSIKIELCKEDDVIWTKTSSKNQASVSRGEVLVMPALNVPNTATVYILDEVTSWGNSNRNLYVYDGDGAIGDAFPGIWVSNTETIGSYTYRKATVSAEANGKTCSFIYSNGTSGTQVNFPSTAITGTEKLYYRTDGILIQAITDPETPEDLYGSDDVRIWVYLKNSTADLNIYCYAFDGNSWGDWQSNDIKMTKYTATSAQNESGSWYYFSVPSDKRSNSCKLIFSFGGDGDANQTYDTDSVTPNTNLYFGIDNNGDNKKYVWKW